MSFWADAPPPPVDGPISAMGWFRAALRGTLTAAVILGFLLTFLPLRLVEWPLFGLRRPITPYLTRIACRLVFVVLGIRHRVSGRPMRAAGAVVSNHASWLDILALNACAQVYFVSKSEVARWPGIGWLARVTGTVFINRDGREARAQKALFETRLDLGHRLLFFPEGTSTDGLRVLPFKPTLFAAFFARHLKETCAIQPATVIYHAPQGQAASFYGWWADMDFAGHLLKILAAPRQGSVEIVFHAPLPVANYVDRKHLAKTAEDRVRAALPARGG